MCGIVGYVGRRPAQDLIYKGLARLEYRGYDSAGIAALENCGNDVFTTRVIKAPGKLKELKAHWKDIDFLSGHAIGHTRWATHGEANQANAHPHRAGAITIVHNGIIENHAAIREKLRAEGVKFSSDTDSELFSHLVSAERDAGRSLLESVRLSFQKIHGASAFVVMDERLPGTIVVARNGSPLVIGIGEGENFVASDVPAILDSTRSIYYLEDNELAELTAKEVKVFTMEGKAKSFQPVQITWALDSIDKQGYEHYMLKEIHEQPRALTDTLAAWLDLATGEFRLDAAAVSKKTNEARKQYTHDELVTEFTDATALHIVACGTAAHAGFYGQQLFERVAKIPTTAELASEFRYREPVLRKTDIGLVISQSGETADTLAAVKLMKQSGMKVFTICNVRDSSIARECDAAFYTNAGIEVGVASTKALTTQLALIAVLAGACAAEAGVLTKADERKWVEGLSRLPEAARHYLEHEAEKVKRVAVKYASKKGFLFLGRGTFFPIALEGALKLKEIAYVHAEGYSAGELKHGPIAMVEPEMLVIAIAPEGKGLVHSKSVSNFEEVKARKGPLLSICAAEDTQLQKMSEEFLAIPNPGLDEVLPILALLPLQLFAYEVAVFKGTEVDQPRNLAKSVTVE
ncbi:MAG: glutamine--fructose-6-phosphate transaminase (isomerizing) [Bdellovibrionota bacterium]